MCRNDISNARIVMDNQQSTEKRATTVCELLATKLNNPDFAPETEVVEDLHADFSNPIHIPHSRVAALSSATPDKVQEKFSTMNVNLVRIVRNWERSGQGDGGIDVDNDGDEDGDFGQLSNRSRGALCTRAGILVQTSPIFFTSGRCSTNINSYALHSLSWIRRCRQRMVVRVFHQLSTTIALMTKTTVSIVTQKIYQTPDRLQL
jgi:hypothetical protein